MEHFVSCHPDSRLHKYGRILYYYIAVSGRRHDWAEIGRQRHGRQCQRGLRLLGLAAPAAVPEVTMSSVRSSGEAEGALLELGAGMKIYFRTVRHHTNPQQLC